MLYAFYENLIMEGGGYGGVGGGVPGDFPIKLDSFMIVHVYKLLL